VKNVLVTGSSGTIGTRLCEQLLRDGYDVVGVDKTPNRWNETVNALTVVGDICTPETLNRLSSSFDLVIHLAANARVHDLVLDPDQAFENIHSTFRILEFCREKAIPRLIFASSREVYGNSDGTPRRESQAHLDGCENPYTASKFSGEAMIKAHARCYDISFVNLRFSNVYGMYDLSDRVVPLFIKWTRQGRDLVIYGEDKLLDFTYIDDAIDGILACIRRYNQIAGMTLNVASGQGTQIIEIAEMISKALNSANQVVMRENRTGEITRFVADISAAKKYLDYEPQFSIAEGLARAIDWYSHCEDPDWLDGTTDHKTTTTTQAGTSPVTMKSPADRDGVSGS
jgi:UDP-glucose 4-epimerase